MPTRRNDDRPDFDPAVADQATMLVITAGLRSHQTNAAAGRNHLSASMAGLTLGVQRADMAMRQRQQLRDPNQAAATANLASTQTVRATG